MFASFDFASKSIVPSSAMILTLRLPDAAYEVSFTETVVIFLMKLAAYSSVKPSAVTSFPSSYFTGISDVESMNEPDTSAYFPEASETVTV